MDKSIDYSFGARIIQAFSRVASIFFISRYLQALMYLKVLFVCE
ncbi:hypothetical protein BACDOR_02786 [Phocaeicola dorei DSM 17855]|uniref:Uncharacterized protein n=1 Tax=Phocaeicola dorei DSM 17855 TaxID=483217 RepID=B6VZR2_9BACT|nr:hypothetical protein BACDOR_02786 [Phocaeicola dorei DSM 17855]